MNITQTFYDQLADHYDKLFADWQAATREQAELLDRLFSARGFSPSVQVLDCACGIGTQAIGLARRGYAVTASDISVGALAEAEKRADGALRLERADFCALDQVFSEQFDIVIAMDNALPHMLTPADLARAVESIAARIKDGGIFVGSIRDYDALLQSKPPYSPPYIHQTEGGKRIAFQTWDWREDRYRLTQYIIEDGAALSVHKFDCEYRAIRRAELTALFRQNGCGAVQWLMPQESGFYQPIIIAEKAGGPACC